MFELQLADLLYDFFYIPHFNMKYGATFLEIDNSAVCVAL